MRNNFFFYLFWDGDKKRRIFISKINFGDKCIIIIDIKLEDLKNLDLNQDIIFFLKFLKYEGKPMNVSDSIYLL